MLVHQVIDVGEHADLRSHGLLAVGASDDLIRGEFGIDRARASTLHDQRALAQVGRERDEGKPRETALVGHDDVGHEPGRHGHVQVRQGGGAGLPIRRLRPRAEAPGTPRKGNSRPDRRTMGIGGLSKSWARPADKPLTVRCLPVDSFG